VPYIASADAVTTGQFLQRSGAAAGEFLSCKPTNGEKASAKAGGEGMGLGIAGGIVYGELGMMPPFLEPVGRAYVRL
jgi:hypothetical protein